jgi:hypothetical protein
MADRPSACPRPRLWAEAFLVAIDAARQFHSDFGSQPVVRHTPYPSTVPLPCFTGEVFEPIGPEPLPLADEGGPKDGRGAAGARVVEP